MKTEEAVSTGTAQSSPSMSERRTSPEDFVIRAGDQPERCSRCTNTLLLPAPVVVEWNSRRFVYCTRCAAQGKAEAERKAVANG